MRLRALSLRGGRGKQPKWAGPACTGRGHSGSWLWNPCGLRLLKPPPRNPEEDATATAPHTGHLPVLRSAGHVGGNGTIRGAPSPPNPALFSGRGWDGWASLLQAEPVCDFIKLR